MQTFAVSEVSPSTQPLETVPVARALAERLGERSFEGNGVQTREAVIEGSDANQDRLVRTHSWNATHPVLEAVHTAFAQHYPLALSPDDVWLCLAQGFALHVEANAEALRSRFVRHEGKLELELRRDHFVMGSPDNDWKGCFAEWSDAIAAHIGKKRDLVVASFSTTGPIERAASELVLMSATRSYFDFGVMTMCGIPAITLLGTVEDWRAIRRRAEVFAEFDLGAWVRVLLPILDQLVAAADGRADRAFWRSIYKRNTRSGGSFVTGWINVLFPYLAVSHVDAGGRRHAPRIVPNRCARNWPHELDGDFEGTTLGSFPRGMSDVPLTWNYFGVRFPMTLSGGFVGFAQDPQTLAVQPAIGWTVQEEAWDARVGR